MILDDIRRVGRPRQRWAEEAVQNIYVESNMEVRGDFKNSRNIAYGRVEAAIGETCVTQDDTTFESVGCSCEPLGHLLV